LSSMSSFPTLREIVRLRLGLGRDQRSSDPTAHRHRRWPV